MRKGVFVVGIVVLVLGAILLGYSVTALSTPYSVPPPNIGALSYSPPALVGSGTINFAWSGATSQFRLSVYSCGSSPCTDPPGPNALLLTTGSGASGSVQFSGSGGQYYLFVANAQTTTTVPCTVSVSGLTVFSLIGIVILAVGAIVALMGYRMKAKVRAPRSDEMPKKELFSLSSTPFSEEQTGAAADAATQAAQTSTSMREREEPTGPVGPVYFQGGAPAPAAGEGAAAGSKRPPLKCPSCGTLNDPWLTTCRSCRRPLARTGT